MYFAIGVEPTNEIAETSGCSSSASTATLSPGTTLKKPSGTQASESSCAVRTDADGSFSDGFSTKVFPHASAGAHIHIGTIAGKLNGVMRGTTPSGGRSAEPATTPSDWWIEEKSPPVEACWVKPPLSSVGRPQQFSITSSPRATSPPAS